MNPAPLFRAVIALVKRSASSNASLNACDVSTARPVAPK